MNTKQLQELSKKVNVLWKQDFPRQKKILALQLMVRKLEVKEEEVTSVSIEELYLLNEMGVKENKKLLKRIVWLEAALLKKADKPTKKAVKAEVKKQEKGLLSLIKKALSKKFKK